MLGKLYTKPHPQSLTFIFGQVVQAGLELAV